ncbi:MULTISPECIES: helix-turn-helix domain-containing protein [Rhizobium/Agrobacterium group]|jgi:transcriptional regulator with XRE-family HTH domain|uniref:helix-turn-helix domain-containing protein n=1 Tax=Rhizobium/Agrobacterium group TaxID=227290 RepID=UPI000713B42B|nr:MULTISPECIES: helix-turn-helix transcriptional regulator [Rhizobium/Agrobacterium group]KQY45806.1 XRE family transcriptional regulator [Rhizobium sp. Root483D2]
MSIVLNNFDNLGLEAIAGGTVGSQVKAHRESAGYSIEDLAVTCGLANTEIAAIEDGSDADPAKLRRIAAALQVSVAALLGTEV